MGTGVKREWIPSDPEYCKQEADILDDIATKALAAGTVLGGFGALSGGNPFFLGAAAGLGIAGGGLKLAGRYWCR